MINKSNTRIEGTNVLFGDLLMNRLIPTDSVQGVGPFLLLDHCYPVCFRNASLMPLKLNEHPHRGLLSFTFVIKGELEHFDSLGSHEIAGEGSAHWLSSGSGVMHGERASQQLIRSEGTLQYVQFWIDIPATKKTDAPKYRHLNADSFPKLQLPEHSGTMSVLLGKSGSAASPVESVAGEFLYLVTLNPKSEFKIYVNPELNRAVFIPTGPLFVNGNLTWKSELFIAENESNEIVLRNPDILPVDAFILGGPEPTEAPIVQGPFVMNSQDEIAEAYRDFFAGAYGNISRSIVV